MIIQDLVEEVIDVLKTIPSIKFIDTDRGQLADPGGFQGFNTPAAFVRAEIQEVVQYLNKQYFNVDIIITIITKEYTKGEPVWTFWDVSGDIYKSLQKQHFNQLCSPLVRTQLQQDFIFLDRNFGFITFNTNIDDRDLPSIGSYTYSATASLWVESYFSPTQSYNPTQSKIDIYN